uniref:ATP synthase complex subunit 8 n=1 Tax=Polydactylus sexfilis TaxID=621112 RepID=C6G417_9TELE|nr:ATP synthase F0 subunit 8 [Polydactylus sexfilis]WNH20546.1 ATP synthase F0 subunit 8 [Polydactylus sexfilis]
MPQLNPSPWFYIFMTSWLVLLTVVFPKTLNHTFSNEPALQNTQETKRGTWLWPWS